MQCLRLRQQFLHLFHRLISQIHLTSRSTSDGLSMLESQRGLHLVDYKNLPFEQIRWGLFLRRIHPLSDFLECLMKAFYFWMELAYVFSIVLNILFFAGRQINGSIPQVPYSSLSRCLSCSKGCLSVSTGASSTFQCPTTVSICWHFCRRDSPLNRLPWACFCFQDHLSSLSSSRVIASILSWPMHLVQIHSFSPHLLLSFSSHLLQFTRSNEFRL